MQDYIPMKKTYHQKELINFKLKTCGSSFEDNNTKDIQEGISILKLQEKVL